MGFSPSVFDPSPRSRPTATSHGHVPRSCPTVMSHGHVPRSCPTVMSHGHVPRSCPTVMSHGHVPRSRHAVERRVYGAFDRAEARLSGYEARKFGESVQRSGTFWLCGPSNHASPDGSRIQSNPCGTFGPLNRRFWALARKRRLLRHAVSRRVAVEKTGTDGLSRGEGFGHNTPFPRRVHESNVIPVELSGRLVPRFWALARKRRLIRHAVERRVAVEKTGAFGLSRGEGFGHSTASPVVSTNPI